MLDIKIDMRDVERQVSMFSATIKEIETARARALRKTARDLSVVIKREVAAKKRIPQKAIANRFFISRVRPGDGDVTLWAGTMHVPLVKVGTPKQTKRGAKVGRRFYRGAFVARIYSDKEQVWIRKSSKHYDPAKYPTRKRHGDRFGFDELHFKGRFPVVRAAVPIDDIIGKTMKDLRVLTPGIFAKKFGQEMNYILNVRRR